LSTIYSGVLTDVVTSQNHDRTVSGACWPASHGGCRSAITADASLSLLRWPSARNKTDVWRHLIAVVGHTDTRPYQDSHWTTRRAYTAATAAASR